MSRIIQCFVLFGRTELVPIDSKLSLAPQTQPSIPSVLGEKADLTGSLFSSSIDCPVEIDNLIGTSHVSTSGNLIVLPSMQNLPSIEHNSATLQLEQDIEQPSNSEILL